MSVEEHFNALRGPSQYRNRAIDSTLLTLSLDPLSCAGARRFNNHNLHASQIRGRDQGFRPGGGNRNTTAPALSSSCEDVPDSLPGNAATVEVGVSVDIWFLPFLG